MIVEKPHSSALYWLVGGVATLAILCGCQSTSSSYASNDAQFAFAAKPPKVPTKPKPKPKPIPQPSPPIGTFGSGDAIPVASYGPDGQVMGATANLLVGVAPGDAIDGLAGAVWADKNNDGYVDGYLYNGQYYSGVPTGYDPTTRSVLAGAARGALGGAALGAASGAVIPGVSVLQGAVIGAAVGGLKGAIWADRNNDGVVDGYVYNGQYYSGAPSATPLRAPTNDHTQERG